MKLTVAGLQALMDATLKATQDSQFPTALRVQWADVRALCAGVIGGSHMGCAADVVILEDSEEEARPTIDYEQRCLDVAAALKTVHGIADAHAEQMGGNIWCVVFREDDQYQWVAGMSNECWGADLVADSDGSADDHLTTPVRSTWDDVPWIARALADARWAWRVVERDA